MTVNLKYIEAVCNSYNDIDDQRFCFLLHHLHQGVNQLNHDINIAFCLILVCFIILFWQNRKIKKLLENIK